MECTGLEETLFYEYKLEQWNFTALFRNIDTVAFDAFQRGLEQDILTNCLDVKWIMSHDVKDFIHINNCSVSYQCFNAGPQLIKAADSMLQLIAVGHFAFHLMIRFPTKKVAMEFKLRFK